MDGRPSPLRIWLSASRPRTLPAAVAPVLVGCALAWREGTFVPPAAASCLGFALLIQIGTNFANDYYDYIQGADTAERVGPRRAVASGWVAPGTMKAAMIAVFSAAFLAGLTLLPYGGWPLLAVGVTSILCGIAYTGGPYPLGYHGLGDLFVFLFFGLVAVGATYFVQAGTLSRESLLAGVAVGALAANILVVNNYRDVETDAKAGKRTLVVRWGRRFAQAQFAFGHGVALAIPFMLAADGAGTWTGAILILLALGPLAAAQMRVLATAQEPRVLIRLLARTGQYVVLYALALSASLILK